MARNRKANVMVDQVRRLKEVLQAAGYGKQEIHNMVRFKVNRTEAKYLKDRQVQRNTRYSDTEPYEGWLALSGIKLVIQDVWCSQECKQLGEHELFAQQLKGEGESI